jgi:hypothetical protein
MGKLEAVLSLTPLTLAPTTIEQALCELGVPAHHALVNGIRLLPSTSLGVS